MLFKVSIYIVQFNQFVTLLVVSPHSHILKKDVLGRLFLRLKIIKINGLGFPHLADHKSPALLSHGILSISISRSQRIGLLPILRPLSSYLTCLWMHYLPVAIN